MANISVLIVDDNDAYRTALHGILSQSGMYVQATDSGQKAVEMVREKAYDVVFLDINVPDTDSGVTAFKEMKKIRPDTIVFMMAEENTAPSINGEMFTIIQKPFDITKAVGMITTLGKKGVVLVVDDNESDRVTLSDILREKGYRVQAAEYGQEAVDFAKKNEFDVVLLDMHLPDMSGIEVIEKIKEHKPALAIIAVTGYNIDGIINSIAKSGVYTCLLKPFDAELLLKEVDEVITRKNTARIAATSSDLSQYNILVVEDNDSIRETTRDILSDEGYTVKESASLKEAIPIVEKEMFNLVISDLSLGSSSGLSLVEMVRKKDSSTIFLLVTGAGSMETALEAIKKGVDEYILKPIEPGELLHKVKTYLDKQKIKKEKEFLMQQLQESNSKLLELVKVDELTGAFNRRYLFEQLFNEMQRSRRQRSPLSLMMCDVDGFKKYNDKYGHLDGDKLLSKIVDLIKAGVRQYIDTVFRYGGDEFAILVPGINKENSKILADRIVAKVGETLRDVNVSLSIGIASFSDTTKEISSINELIHEADSRLYEAKRAGGNKAVN